MSGEDARLIPPAGHSAGRARPSDFPTAPRRPLIRVDDELLDEPVGTCRGVGMDSGATIPARTPPPNANGHRRRQLTARVKAEESDCALCDQSVDKSLYYLAGEHGKVCPRQPCAGCIPDPLRGEVDEDVPRSRGGSPYDRENCHLMHRKCNQFKNEMTIAEARAKLRPATQQPWVEASPIW